MKHRKVTILAQPVAGSGIAIEGEPHIMFCGRDQLLVNEKVIRHHGFTIGVDRDEGFLTLTLINVEKEVFEEFMVDETPDDVFEGTGIPTFRTEHSSGIPFVDADELSWEYGTNIVLPVHDIELRVVRQENSVGA